MSVLPGGYANFVAVLYGSEAEDQGIKRTFTQVLPYEIVLCEGSRNKHWLYT